MVLLLLVLLIGLGYVTVDAVMVRSDDLRPNFVPEPCRTPNLASVPQPGEDVVLVPGGVVGVDGLDGVERCLDGGRPGNGLAIVEMTPLGLSADTKWLELRQAMGLMDMTGVVEGSHTYSGQERDLLFPHGVGMYGDRFSYHLVDFPDWMLRGGTDPTAMLSRDAYQGRVGGQRVLAEAQARFPGQDILLCNLDADEILSAEAVASLRAHPPPRNLVVSCSLRWHLYSTHWSLPQNWTLCMCVRVGPETRPEDVDLEAARFRASRQANWPAEKVYPEYPVHGWHFTWFLTPKKCLSKMQAYAHQHLLFEHPDLRNLDTWIDMQRTGLSPNKMSSARPINSDVTIPHLPTEWLKRYGEMMVRRP